MVVPPSTRPVAHFEIFPPQGAHPEDARASSTLFSRAFIPPCILKLKDCLSRTSHPPKQAGTLDALFIYCCANAVLSASCFARMHECTNARMHECTNARISGKGQRLHVVRTHPRALGLGRKTLLPPHERAVIYFGALILRAQAAARSFA
jgi:hypothetical protein